MPNLYCDNYAVCHGFLVDRGTPEQTETRARIKGWHVFHGETIGGQAHDAVLCPRCLGPYHCVRTPASQPLPGQEGLFAA